MENNIISRNAEVHIGTNGDTYIFCNDYVPTKRGTYGVFHMKYENIENKKDFSKWINVLVIF